jgi:predicted aconitase with swiveling domain
VVVLIIYAGIEAHSMKTFTLVGRIIKEGTAAGRALVSPEPIGFLGGVDPESGQIIEKGHPLEGECISGTVLCFPTGKGSTVGSYTLYRMKKGDRAPVAILNAESETIVAVGAIISEIPMVDQLDLGRIRTGDWVRVEGAQVTVNPTN